MFTHSVKARCWAAPHWHWFGEDSHRHHPWTVCHAVGGSVRETWGNRNAVLWCSWQKVSQSTSPGQLTPTCHPQETNSCWNLTPYLNSHMLCFHYPPCTKPSPTHWACDKSNDPNFRHPNLQQPCALSCASVTVRNLNRGGQNLDRANTMKESLAHEASPTNSKKGREKIWCFQVPSAVQSACWTAALAWDFLQVNCHSATTWGGNLESESFMTMKPSSQTGSTSWVLRLLAQQHRQIAIRRTSGLKWKASITHLVTECSWCDWYS